MWTDYDDKIIDNIFNSAEKSENAPFLCDTCKNKSVHLYMHIYNNTTGRGGLWIWCSSCHSFLHSSVYVPSGWENCLLAEKEKLCSPPICLENIKAEIDKHTNKMINKGVFVFEHKF